MGLLLEVATETLRLKEPFRISGYVFETWDVVRVTLSDGGHRGRGEGGGAYFLGDDVPNMLAQIEAARALIQARPSRTELLCLMPAGGARNAVDCALWELEAAHADVPVWELAGLDPPRPLRTTFTIGADEPDAMAARARRYAEARSIKVKLTGDIDLDLTRVAAIRTARPDVWIGVDGNQGFVRSELDRLVAGLVKHGVALLEQPLRRGSEADLDGYRSPIPIAGDESLLTGADIETAAGRFDVVNIKLDKCGGLTEGLAMAAAARRQGMGVMVGCMVGTGLAMAPAFVLGQSCDLVDLDGPTFISNDLGSSVTYSSGRIWSGPQVWGG
ncbi:dipeptide epimerase [Sphingosinicellaceae bacterium]|nr:dipeptide epimerase [Sphingosinicellaceae bacterium]